MKNIFLKIKVMFIFLNVLGCCPEDNYGIRGDQIYEDYIEVNALLFIANEVLNDIDRFNDKDDSTLKLINLEAINNDKLFVAREICKWTPQFGNFDFLVNPPRFDCYKFPISDNLSLKICDLKDFNSDPENKVLVVISKPFIYDWGGFIEVTLYSEKFGMNNPTFNIIQRGKHMYLHSIGGISRI